MSGRRFLFALLSAGLALATARLVGLVVDPLLDDQWHLKGPNQEPAGANVRAAWNTVTGTGVVIGIVDDGLQHAHPDLNANYVAAHSFDFNGNDPDPNPSSTNRHGTAVGGVAAAVGDNGIGVSGAAPDAEIAGLRLIAGPTSDADEADALGFHPNGIHIMSNSWGPSDSGGVLDGPGPLTFSAIQSGATSGRNGLGRVYVWAAGNGNQSGDNCNFDGYANNRFTIAVAALNDFATQSFYSEPCSAMFVTAPSNGGNRGITTTDLVGGQGYSSSDYTDTFGGTSSAAPLVSGIIGLLLSHNPALTRRDVDHILAESSVKVDPGDPGWTTGSPPHNEKYGFGLINANAAVQMAGNWTPVSPQVATPLFSRTLDVAVPDNDINGVTDTITLNSTYANFTIERVEVEFDASHEWRGDLDVILTSPSGVQSHLAPSRPGDSSNLFPNWRLGSVRHWGETANGPWTLRVSDQIGDLTGTWHGWTLRLYGTQGCVASIAPGNASYGSGGGNGSVAVTAGAGCGWTATKSAPWITFTGDSSGTGNGNVPYAVAPNNTTSQRSGSIVIQGHTHSITQAGLATNVVTVLTPNGGERTFTGTPLFIDWNVTVNTPISAFDVRASVDNGQTYFPVPGCTGLGPAVRRCVWAAPGPATTSARVKVIAEDVNGNNANDVSNGSFKIVNGAATLAVTTPGASASWGIGSSRKIKWSHNLGANSFVKLEISRDGGSTWTTLNAAVQNTATTTVFPWVVTGPASQMVRFKVTWTGGQASATSAQMEIATPFVTVTSPNTQVQWGIGAVKNITWAHNLGTSAFVRIDISRDNGTSWNAIVPSVKNSGGTTGTASWQVTGPATAQARIRVVWLANTAVKDASDTTFTIF